MNWEARKLGGAVVGASNRMPEDEPIAVRHELHILLDHIPDAVELSLLTAPPDDEPESEEERSAVEEARSEPGTGTPHEEVLREFGL
jgi:hypothetical protein